MPVTYIPLATQTLGSAAASVTFSSIPGTYTDLVLIATAIRGGTPGNGAANFNMTFNGDTGSNYSSTLLFETPGSDRQTNTTSLGYVGSVGDNNRMQNIVNIMNYSNSTTNKTVLSRFGSTVDGFVRVGVGLWRNTSAITSFTITPNLGIATGSTFTLYGVKSA